MTAMAISSFAEAEPWSECAVSCGTGLISKSRTCYNGVTGIDYVGDEYQQSECYATEKGFNMWSDWTECTATCGGGKELNGWW